MEEPVPYYVTGIKRKSVMAVRYDGRAGEREIVIHEIVGFRVVEPVLDACGFWYRDGYFCKQVPKVKNLQVSVRFSDNGDLLVGLKYEKELLFLRRVEYMHQFQNLMFDMFDIDILKDVTNADTDKYISVNHGEKEEDK
jgi:hypothetical protein